MDDASGLVGSSSLYLLDGLLNLEVDDVLAIAWVARHGLDDEAVERFFSCAQGRDRDLILAILFQGFGLVVKFLTIESCFLECLDRRALGDVEGDALLAGTSSALPCQ